MSERIIMGIDPGTIVMGYGLIEVRGQEARLLALGVIRPQQVRGPLPPPQAHLRAGAGPHR